MRDSVLELNLIYFHVVDFHLIFMLDIVNKNKLK